MSYGARNALLVALSFVVVFPASVFIANAFASNCASSFDRAERAMLLWAGVIAVAALIATAGGTWRQVAGSAALQVGIVAAASITLANLDFGSLDRSRQKRTIADMRTIVHEIDAVRARQGTYPVIGSVRELQRLTRRKLPHNDAWENAFLLRSTGGGYTLTSFGLCGEEDLLVQTDRSSPHADLVVVNGRFVRAPAWYEPRE